MRKWIVFIALMVLIGTAIIFSTFNLFSPRYNGRPIVDLMQVAFVKNGVFDPTYSGTPEAQEADDAIRAIGTNAIPYYLHLLKTSDDAEYKRATVNWLEEHVSEGLNGWFGAWPDSRYNLRACGGYGLAHLGPSAKSAIPELVRMLDSSTEERADELISVIGSLGTDGIPPLVNSLARPGHHRVEAVMSLGNYLTKSSGYLTNSDADIESASKTIIPVMITLLTDKDEFVHRTAAFSILFTHVQVNLNRSEIASALASSTSPYSGDELLVHVTGKLSIKQPNAIAILEEISRDTNSAYSTQASNTLARLRSNSIPLTSH